MKKISTKVMVVITAIIFLSVFVTGGICFYQIMQQSSKNYEEYIKALYDDYDAMIANQIDNAISVLSQVHGEYQAGKISLEEAQTRGADIIREMRYAKSGYFWIDTVDHINIVNLGKDTEGKSRADLQDINGMYIIRESNRIALEGGGYFEYWFPKPGEEEPLPKRSYSALFEPWQWVVGTGNYIDDLNIIALTFKENNDKNTQNLMMITAISMICTIFVGIGVAFLFGKKLAKPIVKLKNIVHDAAVTGDLEIEFDVSTRDETFDLAQAFQLLIDSMREQANNAQKIAEGDVSIKIVPKSDKDVLAWSTQKVVKELGNLMSELDSLTEAAANGDLSLRGNEKKFKGGYRDIIKGMNNTIDGIAEPINIASDFIQKLAEGNADNKIKNNYKGQYGDLINNLNSVLESFFVLNSEIMSLNKATLEGNLSYRGDINKLKGTYKDLVSGINDILDAVISPLREASQVMQQLSKGNLEIRVKGDYKGDFEEIKKALNFTGETVQGYINQTANILKGMANKDFSMDIQNEYLGDFKILKDSINHIVQQLNVILGEINAASKQVEESAGQVASTSQSLSQGASEQASSVEEIGATVTEVADQTTENAENANKANDLSMKAKGFAERGNEQMQDMLSAMNEIKDSSKNIANIIKVIDEIAFQTNILALNAAVEAARAGEHGKGFAVVAEEVRNLAARSANAAKETTDMIDNSINKVDEGYKIANDTAAALHKIVKGISDTVEVVSKIANASNNQASSISEINKGVEQISDVTQNNTATAEESASASEEMASQAQILKGLVEAFELKAVSEKNIPSNTLKSVNHSGISLDERALESMKC